MTDQTGLFHNVFFWLKADAAPDAAHRIAEGCQRQLAHIPGILRMTVGTPAGTHEPPVDNSFAIALLIEFPDCAAHQAYETHPDHLRFIEEFGPLFGRVTVYDATPVK